MQSLHGFAADPSGWPAISCNRAVSVMFGPDTAGLNPVLSPGLGPLRVKHHKPHIGFWGMILAVANNLLLKPCGEWLINECPVTGVAHGLIEIGHGLAARIFDPVALREIDIVNVAGQDLEVAIVDIDHRRLSWHVGAHLVGVFHDLDPVPVMPALAHPVANAHGNGLHLVGRGARAGFAGSEDGQIRALDVVDRHAFFFDLPALLMAIATACFCGLPAAISVLIFWETAALPLPFTSGIIAPSLPDRASFS